MTNNVEYSVRMKNGAGWRSFSQICLMISVGKEYHEGNKLIAVVNWINRNPEIKSVHVSVNDSLQRYNLIAAGKSETEAEEIALYAGRLWIERNSPTLANIKTAKCTCTRWNDWLHRSAFKAAHQEILSYQRTDALFENAVTIDARSLAERKSKRGEFISDNLVVQSQRYIEEEMAIFAVQTQELPAAEIYPGSNLKAAEYLLGKQGLPLPLQPLAHRYFARIDFAKINIPSSSAVPKPGIV